MKKITLITLVALTLTTILVSNASAFEYFNMEVVEKYALKTVMTTIEYNTGSEIYSYKPFKKVTFIKGSYMSGSEFTEIASQHSDLHEKVSFALKDGDYKNYGDVLVTVFEVEFRIKGETKIATGILYASRFDRITTYLEAVGTSKIFNKKNRAFKKAQKRYLKQLAIFE